MKILTTLSDLKEAVYNAQISGKKIGLCPTMGYLHKGHMRLVKRSNKECDCTIATIYVNRSQFNDSKDFDLYPRDLERDIQLLENESVDVLWIPNEEEVNKIPLDFQIDFKGLDQVLEGKYRPGHFQGVAEVVYRFFKAVQPNCAYFGAKDYQQLKVIELLNDQNNLNINIVAIPIEREEDGLAMSSRNARLSEKSRNIATHLFKALINLWPYIQDASFDQKKKDSIKSLAEKGFEVEYLEYHNFTNEDNQSEQRLLIAAKLDGIRLIDNIGQEDIKALEL